jgi:aminomethyltransferase
MDFIETLVPGNIKDLKDNAARLTQFTNLHGGIMDDTVVTRKNDKLLYIVVNAGCCDQDVQHIKENLNRYKLQNPQADVAFEFMEGQSLVALQGPEAPDVLQPLLTSDINLANLPFMSCVDVNLPALSNTPVQISRCGYTGEDGFEISVPDIYVTQFTELLLKDQRVKLAGLGARDTLRLEAGLCLMGHDMNDQITPIEAGLSFTIGKRRQEEANFPGATVINNQIKNGTNIKRIGLLLDSNKMVAREGYVIRDEKFTTDVGHVTSGTISPILDKSIAMGYVNSAFSTEGTKLVVSIRGQPFQATVVKMPFVPHRYYRKPVTKK